MITTKSALTALVMTGLLALPATAQTAPAPAAPMVAPSLGTPKAPEPTTAQIALGRELIVASGISRSLDSMVPQFLDQISTTLTQTRPDLIRDLNTVNEAIKPEFDKRAADLITEAGKLYATRLSEKDLKDSVDFFKSAAGKNYVATQPLVLSDLVKALQGWQQQVSVDMMTRVRAEMKKKGHEL